MSIGQRRKRKTNRRNSRRKRSKGKIAEKEEH
jgi:hypothetical protein